MTNTAALPGQTPTSGNKLSGGCCQHRAATRTSFAVKSAPCCSLNSCITTSRAGRATSCSNRAILVFHKHHLLSKPHFDFPAKRASYQENKAHLPQPPMLLGQDGPFLPQQDVCCGLVSPVPIAARYGPGFTPPPSAESPQGQTWWPQHLPLPPHLPAILCQRQKSLSPGQFKPVRLGVTPPCPGAARQPISPILCVPSPPSTQLRVLQSCYCTKPKQSFGSI